MILIVALFGIFGVVALAFQYSVLVGLVVTLPMLVVFAAVGFLMLYRRDE